MANGSAVHLADSCTRAFSIYINRLEIIILAAATADGWKSEDVRSRRLPPILLMRAVRSAGGENSPN